jgi:hypothetical protein
MASFLTTCGLGEEISVDLMTLNGKTALHVVYYSTSYSSAAYIPSHTTAGVWQALLNCWITFLSGYSPRDTKRFRNSVYIRGLRRRRRVN